MKPSRRRALSGGVQLAQGGLVLDSQVRLCASCATPFGEGVCSKSAERPEGITKRRAKATPDARPSRTVCDRR